MAKQNLQTKDNKTKYCTAVTTERLWLQQQHNDTYEECSSTAKAAESIKAVASARRELLWPSNSRMRMFSKLASVSGVTICIYFASEP